MKTILATTDLSAASKSGLNMSLQLALQTNAKIIFFHSFTITQVASLYPKLEYTNILAKEKNKALDKLKRFIFKSFKPEILSTIKHDFVTEGGLITVKDITEAATKFHADCIVIGTHGATGLEKVILGTNTTQLIKTSKIPVLAVPPKFKAKSISKILYCSDFKKIESEAQRLIEHLKKCKAELNILHVAYPAKNIPDPMLLTLQLKKKFRYPNLQVHLKKADLNHKLIEDLERYAKQTKTDLIVMFTQQQRNLFERLFLGSNTIEMAYKLKTPLLCFPKK